jgi:hypothetical protein
MSVEFNFLESWPKSGAVAPSGRKPPTEVLQQSPAERQAAALAEAKALAVNPYKSRKLVTIHFDLQNAIAAAHKAQDWELSATLGRHWLARFDAIIAAMKKFFGPLPRINVFTYYVAALTKLGLLDEAESALTVGMKETIWDGTQGGLAARLEKVRKLKPAILSDKARGRR